MEQMQTLLETIPKTTTLRIIGTQSLNASSILLQNFNLTLSFSPFSSSYPVPSSIICFQVCLDSLLVLTPYSKLPLSSCVSLLTSMSDTVTLLILAYSLSCALFLFYCQILMLCLSGELTYYFSGCQFLCGEVFSGYDYDFTYYFYYLVATTGTGIYYLEVAQSTGTLLLLMSYLSVSKSIDILTGFWVYLLQTMSTGSSLLLFLVTQESILDLISLSSGLSIKIPSSSFSFLSLFSRLSSMPSLTVPSPTASACCQYSYSQVNLNYSSQKLCLQSSYWWDRSQQNRIMRWISSRGREKHRMDQQNWDTLMYYICNVYVYNTSAGGHNIEI